MGMHKRLLTNRLHCKAAELAVLTEITMLQLQNTLSTVQHKTLADSIM